MIILRKIVRCFVNRAAAGLWIVVRYDRDVALQLHQAVHSDAVRARTVAGRAVSAQSNPQ